MNIVPLCFILGACVSILLGIPFIIFVDTIQGIIMIVLLTYMSSAIITWVIARINEEEKKEFDLCVLKLFITSMIAMYSMPWVATDKVSYSIHIIFDVIFCISAIVGCIYFAKLVWLDYKNRMNRH